MKSSLDGRFSPFSMFELYRIISCVLNNLILNAGVKGGGGAKQERRISNLPNASRNACQSY